jgi:glutamyl-tRNA synthetase
MSLEELINEVSLEIILLLGCGLKLMKFDLSVMTHRSSSLDPAKLEYISKHHLMRAWSTSEGLTSLAEKVHEEVKERFPLR